MINKHRIFLNSDKKYTHEFLFLIDYYLLLASVGCTKLSNV